jgi:transaldolase
MNTLLQLITYGQSYWLDNLTRRKITGRELKRRVTEQGLRGVTSNPAIFEKAISGGEDYDAHIQQLIREGCEIHELYERLVVTDIQDACDLLRPVYDASDGEDGFVSLEVSPHLVHDTVGTMVEARRLWNAVARPNVFIKIPGTPTGVPAIEEMLYEGININITLLFAIKDYEAVAQAYISALERRVAEGQPVKHVASVASFFLSRIDVLVDQLRGWCDHLCRGQTAGGVAGEGAFRARFPPNPRWTDEGPGLPRPTALLSAHTRAARGTASAPWCSPQSPQGGHHPRVRAALPAFHGPAP